VCAAQRDIILRVTSTAICGSDLHMYCNAMPGMKSGDIVGHEFMVRLPSLLPCWPLLFPHCTVSWVQSQT
jgi:hypothetical protein